MLSVYHLEYTFVYGIQPQQHFKKTSSHVEEIISNSNDSNDNNNSEEEEEEEQKKERRLWLALNHKDLRAQRGPELLSSDSKFNILSTVFVFRNKGKCVRLITEFQNSDSQSCKKL